MKKVVFIIICFGIVGCAEISEEKSHENTPGKEVYTKEETVLPVFHASHEPKKQNTPFSDAVEVGNTFYLSGQIGMDHTVRKLVEGGIQAETKQALENIRAVLLQHQLSLKDVVKVTVILDDINDFKAFNDIYVQYLPQKPARTTFAAEALALGAKIEIEVVAVASEK